jgi:hypothetical protein
MISPIILLIESESIRFAPGAQESKCRGHLEVLTGRLEIARTHDPDRRFDRLSIRVRPGWRSLREPFPSVASSTNPHGPRSNTYLREPILRSQQSGSADADHSTVQAAAAAVGAKLP